MRKDQDLAEDLVRKVKALRCWLCLALTDPRHESRSHFKITLDSLVELKSELDQMRSLLWIYLRDHQAAQGDYLRIAGSIDLTFESAMSAANRVLTTTTQNAPTESQLAPPVSCAVRRQLPACPSEVLVKITVDDQEVLVPKHESLLRALQHLAPEEISTGRFCWNEQCHNCAVKCDMGNGTRQCAGLACRLQVEEGMRVTTSTPELRYRVRSLART